MFILVALVTPCRVVTADGGINALNGNAVCCYFCIIIARCGKDGDADSESSRTRKVHLMSMYITHTHTHNEQRGWEKRHDQKAVKGKKQQHRLPRVEMPLYSFLMNGWLPTHTDYFINTNGMMLL